MSILFEMCINDYNGYGQSTRRLHAAEFADKEADEDLHLDCIWDSLRDEITCYKVDDHHIRVGRRKFPILGYHAYVGNMMWDACTVTRQVANAIAAELRRHGGYEPSEGTSELWDKWESGAALFEEQVTP